jgi:protein-S-isoprenylcysteine O-methyltransferase Ste14
MLNAIHSLFNHPTARKLFLALRVPLILLLVGLVAYYARVELLCVGFSVSMFGQLIQLWSFASLVKNEQLTARGPYVMVRNPMYLGRYFLILGFIVVTGSVIAMVLYTLFYWFYMYNRVRREEVKLGEGLGEPYRNYCATVNRFVPNLLKLGAPAVRFFDLGVIRNNNGHWNLLATLIAWAVLYAYLRFLR